MFVLLISFTGTREAAFVHAISAAGVAHSVTRSCSSGDLQKCGCDRTVSGSSNDGFMWSGCSDNIAFGVLFSKTFVDAREKKGRVASDRQLMNLHNNEAGRRVSLVKSVFLSATWLETRDLGWAEEQYFLIFSLLFSPSYT